MRIKSFSFIAATVFAVSIIQAGANWQTTSVETDPLMDLVYEGQQASHASDNGQIHLAFVTKNNDQAHLYYTTKSVPVTDIKPVVSPPVLIDVADRISSVQIQHDKATGETHFAYSKQTSNKVGDIVQTNELLIHTLYNPASSESVNITTITSRSPNPVAAYEISLALPFVLTDEANKWPALAYHVPELGQLFYAEKPSPTSNWVTNGIQSLPGLGSGCDLHFDFNGNPAVVYENPGTRTLHFARRLGADPWQTRVIVATIEGNTIEEPSIRMDGFTPSFSYVVRSDANQSLHFGTLPDFNAPLTSVLVDQVSIPNIEGPFIPMIRHPELAITPSHDVYLSYSKSSPSGGGVSHPWISWRFLQSSPFYKLSLPLSPNESGMTTGRTSLSLDCENHPLVSWLNFSSSGGESLNASYNADIVDIDGDGFNYLQELAFLMDPNIPDAHKGPQLKIIADPSGETDEHYLQFSFPVSNGKTISVTERGIFDEDFLFSPSASSDLQNWTSLSGFEVQLAPSKVHLISRYPLGPEQPPRRFFQVGVSRHVKR